MKVSSASTPSSVAYSDSVSDAVPVRAEVLAAASAAIEREFAQRCPQSLLLHKRAMDVFPGGVTHDNRRVAGPSHFVRKAQGARKTDQDGNRYIDYWIGHGALILGHRRKEVLEAIHLAAQDCTHPGACHEREVIWAEQVQALIPSAERVRFTASGSESSALAIRLARAWTGKKAIVKFEGHFHGWLDHAVEAIDLPFETPWSSGVPEEVRSMSCVLPVNDLNKVEALLKKRRDIAGIILEPTGASGGTVPVKPEFLKGLRQLATRYNIALIFDEVITGFRLAPGGAQERFGVLPDITCLAKILAGGLAGGAVCGTREAFLAMEFTADAKRDRVRRVAQYGTFNANPVSAAAGIATLALIQDGVACEKAEAYATKFKAGLNALFRREGLPWAAYGVSSVFHILTSDACTGQPLRDGMLDPASIDPVVLKQKGELDGLLRRALLLEGVDLPPGRQAWISAVHGNEELTETLDAFARAISRLRELRCL
jgi:glutamate-1-semialdehyde 2,1-aminomutase